MARGLTNGELGFIAYADSCLTNQIDANDAFGEELLKNPDGGAVAYIGNTRFSWIGSGDDLQRAFFKRLTTTRHIGLLNDSRVTNLNYNSGGATARWATYALSLTGDPEMPVWRYEPLLFNPEIIWSGDLRVPIEIILPKPGPTPPAWFMVHLQQGQIERGFRAPAGDRLSVDVSDLSPGEFVLSVAAVDTRLDLGPHVQTLVATGPVWLRGKVAEVSHRPRGLNRTEIRLDTEAEQRRLLLLGDSDDYSLMTGAAVEAHLSGARIAFLVTADANGAIVLRFRLPGA
jgi:hypothetical protein